MRLAVGMALLLVVGARASAAPPSLDERVAARRAVEEVLWRHRTWPAENPAPKPPLSAVLTDDEIRSRVVDDLRKSVALDLLWHRPVTSSMLQAELERMRAGSRAPDVFQEMLAAVGNDPVLAREAIARPALVNRLIRSWFAHDDRWQGDVKRLAEARVGGTIAESTVGADEVADRIGRLIDDDDALRMATVKSRQGDRVTLTVRSWPKRSFDGFWSETAPSIDPTLAVPEAAAAARITPDAPSCADNTWHALGAPTPDPRYSHSAVWTGAEMIVFGGWTGSGVTGSGGRYVPATDSWFALSSDGAPSARVGHPAVWTGTEMIVWGGAQNLVSPYGTLGDGARYNPSTDSWRPIAGFGAPAGRRDHSMVWTGSQVVVFGGATNDAGTATNTGGRYDPSTDTWSATSTVGAPAARSIHTAVWTGSVMVVWGGGSLNTGGRYDPLADTWSPTSTVGAPQGRAYHSAVWTGSRMVVWGGSSLPFYFNDGGRYDPLTDTWAPMTTTNPPSTRVWQATVWTGSEMIVWGGSLFDLGSARNDGGRYNPATDTWTAVGSAGAPQKRRSHTGVWTGSEMIVWGGVWEQGSPLPSLQYWNDGGRYSPATDSWVPTSVSTGATPIYRNYHTAVWTGAETIVWGGDAFGSGGRYVSATDTWIPVSMNGAPQSRFEHTAVWSGSEMIVWGGYDGSSNPINTGGRYNPSSDTWAATATANAPPPVAQHTAVWTGSRMVIWGGKTAAAVTQQGGRYDPATDTWVATSLAGAPSGRFEHSAVWTGSRMIVWGGSDQFTDSTAGVNSGGRYDPATDAWTPTTTVGAPQGRVLHAAVWTGSRMIVWGGAGAGAATLFADGGSYDTAADTWSAIATAGAPSARTCSLAAWTGLEMIVWGGNSGVRENTGGRYRPAADAWTPMSVPGAPSGRDAHTTTWAGNKLFVFGGTVANGGPTATGATYCACANVYRDLDGDGYGSTTDFVSSCDGTIPAGYIDRGGDCNDNNPSVHPGARDSTCNGVDEDCNGVADDLWVGGLSQCGLGVCHSTGVFECVNGQVVNDCTPGTPTAASDTVCNGLDDDCDGATDEDYVPRADRWIATASNATTRTNHTAIWSGSEMIVFGGDNGSGSVRTGGDAYAPSTDSWRALAAGPTKRWHHTAVWTGSRMIVWGGDDNVATLYNTGSRYDPATDTWAATTTTGAPTARGGHSAVWTGSRMIVWGGSDAVNGLNSGSRYDPSANTWSAMPTVGAPSARLFHTAVWTGTQMIVWGGQAAPNGSAVAGGGRYDASANTWASVTATGAPSSRYGHVAVWTGSVMLIWGGTDGSVFRGNGARYDPATNTWSAMSLTGAPTARAYASAVWTGTQLIVWGGEGAGGVNADGARYDPASDTWTSMTPESPPSARRHAAPVWTGAELIVWGGDAGGAAMGSGGRYTLQTVCGTGGCQRSGSSVCSGGVVSYQCTPQPPSPEVCDGLDNDCNALVDDGIPPPTTHPFLLTSKLGPVTNQWSWSAAPDATAYDFTRGSLSALRLTGGDFSGTAVECLANDTAATSYQDGLSPAVGDSLWYLVRPVNACSGHGTYDDTVARDASINLSPTACP